MNLRVRTRQIFLDAKKLSFKGRDIILEFDF